MIKLYGYTVSNYFNMVKMALLEKGVEFEVIDTRPSQEPHYLSKSPMGKVPCLETEYGFLSESSVIMEYLEDVCPGPKFMPSDEYHRAKVRELIKGMELYIELPARTCFPEAFVGISVSDEVKESAKAVLENGFAALKRNASFSPYLAGENMTYADMFFQYSIPVAGACAKRIWGVDMTADLPEARELSKLLAERESVKRIAADQRT